jgi:hypothetical protein
MLFRSHNAGEINLQCYAFFQEHFFWFASINFSSRYTFKRRLKVPNPDLRLHLLIQITDDGNAATKTSAMFK